MLGHHVYEITHPALPWVKICKHCKKKGRSADKRISYDIAPSLLIIHAYDDENDVWLANYGKNVWHKEKPKDWIYEEFLT